MIQWITKWFNADLQSTNYQITKSTYPITMSIGDYLHFVEYSETPLDEKLKIQWLIELTQFQIFF